MTQQQTQGGTEAVCNCGHGSLSHAHIPAIGYEGQCSECPCEGLKLTPQQTHVLSVASSFTRPGQWVKCSCGWASPDIAFLTDAEAIEWARGEHVLEPPVARCATCGGEKVIRTSMVAGPVGPIYCPKCEPEVGR